MTSQRSQWLKKKKIPLASRRYGFDPWVRKIPWRRKWEPIPVFLPGKSRGQRSLVGHSPWSCKRVGHDLGTKQQQQNLNTWHLRQRNWRKSAIKATSLGKFLLPEFCVMSSHSFQTQLYYFQLYIPGIMVDAGEKMMNTTVSIHSSYLFTVGGAGANKTYIYIVVRTERLAAIDQACICDRK